MKVTSAVTHHPTKYAVAQEPQKTVVSAYIDGKASAIESPVLDGVDQFERAVAKNPELTVIVDGQRHSNFRGLAIATGIMALPIAGLAYGIATGLNPEKALLVGMGFLATALPAYKTVAQNFQGSSWAKSSRYTIGSEPVATPVKSAGVERLKSLVQQTSQAYPRSRHIVYFSGHGDQDEVASMEFSDIQRALGSERVDGVILDACLTNQLEVISKMSPWAGVVIASSHVVPAKGYPIEKMFSNEVLSQKDDRAMFRTMAEQTAPATFSLSAIDTRVVKSRLLPELNQLGDQLCEELQSGSRPHIEKALGQSHSPNWVFDRRVDLGSFLEKLSEQPFGTDTQQAIESTRAAFDEALIYHKNKNTLSFDLQTSRNDSSVGPDWNRFTTELDRGYKPHW